MTDDPTCREVARLISEGLDAELPAPERARLRLHFVLCDACRNVNTQFAFLRLATRSLKPRDDDGPTVDS